MQIMNRNNIVSKRKDLNEQLFSREERPLPNELLDALEDGLTKALMQIIKKNLPSTKTTGKIKDASLMFVFSYNTTYDVWGYRSIIPSISVQILCAKTRFSNIDCLDIEINDWEKLTEYEIIFNSQYLYEMRRTFVRESSLSDDIEWEDDEGNCHDEDYLNMQIAEIVAEETDYIDECLQIQKEQYLTEILPTEIYAQLKPYFESKRESFTTCYFQKVD